MCRRASPGLTLESGLRVGSSEDRVLPSVRTGRSALLECTKVASGSEVV